MQFSKEHLEFLSKVFMWFEAISSLKINLDKSKLISMVKVSEDLAKALGVKLVISHPPIWASHWELLEIIASLGCNGGNIS